MVGRGSAKVNGESLKMKMVKDKQMTKCITPKEASHHFGVSKRGLVFVYFVHVRRWMGAIIHPSWRGLITKRKILNTYKTRTNLFRVILLRLKLHSEWEWKR